MEAEPHPHAHTSTDYTPDPSKSLPLSAEHQNIVDCVTALYSGSASEKDMQVYAQNAVYDDPFSFCDSRYKIAGQWYGIPKLFAKSTTLATQVVEASPTLIVFRLQQEYTFAVIKAAKTVNSLVSLAFENGKVKYHKDQWNEKDYSHEGIGAIFKKLNGDHLTKITRPPTSL